MGKERVGQRHEFVKNRLFRSGIYKAAVDNHLPKPGKVLYPAKIGGAGIGGFLYFIGRQRVITHFESFIVAGNRRAGKQFQDTDLDFRAAALFGRRLFSAIKRLPKTVEATAE